MAKTLHHGEHEVLPTRRGVPPEEVITQPDKKVALHEMPDLSKEAPEVEYGQPRRSWLRYVAVGATVGAVAVAGGLIISAVTGTQAPTYTYDYSVAREHLAQTPGGFPAYVAPDGTVPFPRSLEMEHLAQTPGGFPAGTEFPATTSLEMEHLAQTPGGYPVSALDLYGDVPYARPDSPPIAEAVTLDNYSQMYLRPDSPAPMGWANAGPVTGAPGGLLYENAGPADDAPTG